MTRPLRSAALRGTAAYVSVGLAQRAIGFLLLPLYARALAPSEYGTIALIVTVFTGAQYLFSFGLELSVFRGYFLYASDEEERERYANTLGLFLSIAPVLLAAAIAGVLHLLPLGRQIPTGLLSLELFAATIYVGATVMPLALIRAKERLGTYVAINSAYAITQVATKALFVLSLDMGVRGWIISDLCASVVVMIVSAVLVPHRWSTRFHLPHLSAALRLGLPMVPHLVSQWALTLVDRFILAALLGAQQVGIYSMGYQFGLLLGMAVTEVNRAVMPTYGRSVRLDSTEQDLSDLSSAATLQILLAVILGTLTAALAPPLIRLILPSSYHRAAAVVPIVALGYIFYGLYYIPMNMISIIAGDTTLLFVPTVVSAIINVLLNFWLIPGGGIFAAGLATALSYGALLLMVGVYKYVRVPRRVPLNLHLLISSGLLIALSYACAIMFLPSDGLISVLSRAIAISGVSGIVVRRHLRSLPPPLLASALPAIPSARE